MKSMSLILRVATYAFALIGILASVATVALLLMIPKSLPEPTLPVNYPFGAYPIGGSAPSFPADFGKAAPGKSSEEPFRLLAISEGGEGGAYGAGLLAASTASEHWPEFDIYTGVSAGALLATMAFVDKVDLDHIGPIVEQIAETIEDGAKRPRLLDLGAALLDDGALVANDVEAIIRKSIDQETVELIAKRYAEGKRLYVVSVDLTTGSPVLWDLGAIAARPGTDNAARVYEALMASISVPVVFPSQIVQSEGDQTLHVDGGIMRPFYISDHFIRLGLERPFEIYFLANIKLNSPPKIQAIAPRLDSILHRLIYLVLRAETDSFLERLLLDKLLFGWTVKVASIPAEESGIRPIDAVTANGLSSAFEAAYGSAEEMLDDDDGLDKVWVPLTPQLIGRDLSCASERQSCYGQEP